MARKQARYGRHNVRGLPSAKRRRSIGPVAFWLVHHPRSLASVLRRLSSQGGRGILEKQARMGRFHGSSETLLPQSKSRRTRSIQPGNGKIARSRTHGQNRADPVVSGQRNPRQDRAARRSGISSQQHKPRMHRVPRQLYHFPVKQLAQGLAQCRRRQSQSRRKPRLLYFLSCTI